MSSKTYVFLHRCREQSRTHANTHTIHITTIVAFSNVDIFGSGLKTEYVFEEKLNKNLSI